jgi:hypothetical protein
MFIPQAPVFQTRRNTRAAVLSLQLLSQSNKRRFLPSGHMAKIRSSWAHPTVVRSALLWPADHYVQLSVVPFPVGHTSAMPCIASQRNHLAAKDKKLYASIHVQSFFYLLHSPGKCDWFDDGFEMCKKSFIR